MSKTDQIIWGIAFFAGSIGVVALAVLNIRRGLRLLFDDLDTIEFLPQLLQWLRKRNALILARLLGLYMIVGCGIPFVIIGLLGIIESVLHLFGFFY